MKNPTPTQQALLLAMQRGVPVRYNRWCSEFVRGDNQQRVTRTVEALATAGYIVNENLWVKPEALLTDAGRGWKP
jgi:hypothetical protein